MLFTTLLNQISSGNSTKIVHSVDSFDITDVALIDGTQTEYTNETLYFGEYKQLPNGHLPPQCVLVRTAESAALADCPGALALVDAGELFLLVNAAKAAVDASRGQGFYGELMDCAARSRSMEPVVNLAAARLGNSVVLLDTDFKILAHSTVFTIDDPLWAQNIRQGYCSYEFVSAVEQLEEVKNAAMTSDPVVVTCYASPLRKLSSKIFIQEKLIGIVLMLEKETPISSAHMQLLPTSYAVAAHYQRGRRSGHCPLCALSDSRKHGVSEAAVRSVDWRFTGKAGAQNCGAEVFHASLCAVHLPDQIFRTEAFEGGCGCRAGAASSGNALHVS